MLLLCILIAVAGSRILVVVSHRILVVVSHHILVVIASSSFVSYNQCFHILMSSYSPSLSIRSIYYYQCVFTPGVSSMIYRIIPLLSLFLSLSKPMVKYIMMTMTTKMPDDDDDVRPPSMTNNYCVVTTGMSSMIYRIIRSGAILNKGIDLI